MPVAVRFSADTLVMSAESVPWDEIYTTVSPFPQEELGLTDSNEANVTVETLRLIDQARSLTMAMAPRGDLYPYCSAEDCLVTFWRTISLDAFENEVLSIKVSGDKEKYFWEWLPPFPRSWQRWYSENGHQQITNSET
jgi:hypothetical protein